MRMEAVVADDADAELVVIADDALPRDRGDDGNAEPFAKRRDSGPRAGPIGAPARDDQRTLGG
jgi:hypothetical protein